MERLTGKDAKLMMEALAAVYEKKGDCVDKDKKTKHNCAKKVCSEQWGEGTCVPEHHTLLEDGTVTHYDVVFEHGLERMVPIQELKVTEKEVHEHASMEGGHIDEGIADDPRFGVVGQAARLGQKMFGNASQRNSAVSYERSVNDLTKSRGGGNVAQGADGKAITAAQIAAQTKKRRLADPKYKPGQGVDSGAKPGSGGKPKPPTVLADRKPAAPAQSPSSNLKPGNPNVVVSPKSGEKTKFERRLPTMAELRAAQAARKASAAGGASKQEAEYQAVKAGVNAGKPAPKPAATGGAAIKPGANAAGSMKPGAAAANAAARTSTAAGKSSGAAAGSMKSGTAGSPAAQAAAGAPNRKEDLFTGKPIQKKSGGSSAGQSVGKTKDMMKKGKDAIFKKEDLDVFDTVKEYLIGEGATEEEALQQMLTLTDEQRTEILEGPALQNTIRTLETRRDKMDKKSPGSSNRSAGGGSQSVGGALYKAYGRQGV